MKIDWFTFVAQILNFLLLVWLLKRFLYQPILEAMDAREKQITARVEKAEDAQRVAQEEAAAYREKTGQLDHMREKLLAEAAEEVKAWREQHLRTARDDVQRARDDWYRSIEREQQTFVRELQRRVAAHVHQLAERILRELANAELESQAFEVFMKRLDGITTQERHQISQALSNGERHIDVESGFPLSEAQANRVLHSIKEGLEGEFDVKFRIEPDLICGIELQAAGYKVAWSAEEMLESVEEDLSRLLAASLDFETSRASHSDSDSTTQAGTEAAT
ncbi:MAG: hypothetical protein R3C18_25580 [Planctomycetaceae bacterium]